MEPQSQAADLCRPYPYSCGFSRVVTIRSRASIRHLDRLSENLGYLSSYLVSTMTRKIISGQASVMSISDTHGVTTTQGVKQAPDMYHLEATAYIHRLVHEIVEWHVISFMGSFV